MSQNAGVTWTQVFNTSMINPDLDAHIHLVSIDPYTGWYYVANGDVRSYPAPYGCPRTRVRRGCRTSSARAPRRPTACSEHHIPIRIEYCSTPTTTPRCTSTSNRPGRYGWPCGCLTRTIPPGVKTYCAVTGEHGVSYMSMTEYRGLGLGHIWLTIDGSSWYLVDGDISDTKLLHIHDGIVYGRNIQFRDLTKEEAAMLIDEGRRSVEMLYDSPRHMYFDQPLKNVQVTITGKTITNYLTNPSFEEEVDGKPSGWTISTVNYESEISEDVYYHGSKSLALNKNPDRYDDDR